METKSLRSNSETKKTIDNKWKKVVIAGVPAIALGSVAGVFAAKNVDVEEVVEEINASTSGPVEQSIPEPIGEIEVATGVNNDMTFDEAFTAAREEVGAGGVFEWNGTVYGTYYETEWNSLTAEEQAQFSHEAMGIPYEPEAMTEEPTEPVVAEVEPEAIAEEPTEPVVAEVEPEAMTEEPTEPVVAEVEPEAIVEEPTEPVVAEVEPEAIAEEPTDAVVAEVEPEVRVVDQAQWEENGNVYTASDVRIDDEQYILIDENGGVVEAMMADFNGDEIITEDEIMEITDMQIQQEDLDIMYAQDMQEDGTPATYENPTDDYLADNPDTIDTGF